MRVVQLSDTHLAAATRVPDPLRRLIDWIMADPPDLVVHSGDIVWEDPDDPVDRQFAHAVFAPLPCPMLAIPGNHDVGFFEQNALDGRVRAFRDTWGMDRFVHESAGWRLVGVDVYAVGDSAADAWLTGAVATDRPLALFVHQPIAGEPDDGWQLPDRVRQRCDELLAGRDVRVIASGHRHCGVTRELDDQVHVWAPSATLEGHERYHDGDPTPGAVEYDFDDDGTWSHRFVRPTT